VYVRQSPGDSLESVGHLAFVDNAVDPASGTLLLKGELANRDGALWPGEFVQVRLVLAVERDAIVVPAPAVTTGQQGTYVYVLNADSTASPRPVTVKRADEVTAVVSSGLKSGETVITDGQFRLAPGVKVLVRKAGQETRP
jgi:multidrug efflux system membrane fusion protein